MNKLWHTFTDLHNGSYLARDIFEELCYEILDKHYPGRKIISNSEIDKASKRSLNVVFLSKFMTDELTNSRKGQIRKAFNSFIEFVEKKKIKIYEWILCIPYTLNDEETKWWGSWQTKNYQKYNINIKLFDGDYILDLTKKYGFFDKYFKKVKNDKIAENKENNEEIKEEEQQIFEIVDDDFDKKIKEKVIEKNSKKNKEVDKPKEIEEDLNSKVSPKTEENKDVVFVEKIKYSTLKKEYERIIEIAKEFEEEQKNELKERNSTENCFKLFEDIDVSNLNVIKLFYKAKSAEVHQNYPLATFLYEKILKDKDLYTLLRFKKDEIPDLLKKCKTKTQAFLYELEADILFLRGSQQKALNFYEKAYKTDKDNKIIAKKYYELLAEKQLENDLPADAHENFEKALKLEKNNKDLEDKERQSAWLARADKVRNIPLINIFPLWFAFSIIKDDNTEKKLKEATKKTYIALSLLAVLVIIAMIFTKINFSKKHTQAVAVAADTLGYLQPVSLEQVAIAKGDKIMKQIDYSKIHLVDSAIADYKRAMKYNSKSQDAYSRLINATNYQKNYLNLVQTNIVTNKDAYFISMRRVSEGLQLFKYIFDPANPKEGKYGYVDTLMNVVIPPVYDFDYNSMYKGTENFNNGKALVLLKLSNGKKQFMQINKQNKIVKIY